MACSSKDEFVEFKTNGIWQYYLREKKGQRAQCKACSLVVKCEGGSTSGLHTHQRTKHAADLLKRPASATETSTNDDHSANGIKRKPAADGAMIKYLLDTKERSLAATIAGILCSKLRSSLWDVTLDTLCFLRSHYRKKQ